ncbi:DUF922 domain-containing protein [Pseudodesulfovibrio sp. F-1]|uniref:DUF922 domain-containing protein n=1 Tax=Pseudodesulfovibrio alkaliphilus TaxID=2661613 RepID=A0A7K1KLN4_9BACT|nr:DUF922 domain-containing protein [Pseudodesulfovibrio alkaliphilus]MUM76975.1 DUF922 domain-containing protein [Pseudodesulfovibrio alkaliphilus]
MKTHMNMATPGACSLLLALLTLFAVPTHAEVVITTATEHYPVDGLTPMEIAENLTLQSPIEQDGRTFQAHTRSDIRYEFTWTRRNDSCTMDKATVYLHIVYKYPRLAQTQDAKTLRWWQEHLDRLTEHELVHGEIALRAAQELDEAFNSLTDLHCATVRDVVKALGDAALQTLKERQRAYDALTDHGRNQQAYTSHRPD